MRIKVDDPRAAARRFNDLLPGHQWDASDMALHDVFFAGWPEGAVPERVWLPTRGIEPTAAAAIAESVAEACIVSVRKLSPAAQANLEAARKAAIDWRPYGSEPLLRRTS